MFINNNINIQDDRLMNGLLPMLNLMSQIEQAGHEEVVIDFSNTRFISPVFILSLLVYTSTCKKNIQIKNMTEYMKTRRIAHFAG